MEAILQLQNGGVEADIWKIEGVDDREACREIAQLARREGRDRVSCVVLGRGASDAKVDEWLRAGSGLDGYIGFAIGRSIFGESVKAYAAGDDFDRDAAVEKIAPQLPAVHRGVRGGTRSGVDFRYAVVREPRPASGSGCESSPRRTSAFVSRGVRSRRHRRVDLARAGRSVTRARIAGTRA